METKFNIGDTVYSPVAGTTGKLIDCPECFGKGELTCILGNGDRVEFDCDCCKYGFNSLGRLRRGMSVNFDVIFANS